MTKNICKYTSEKIQESVKSQNLFLCSNNKIFKHYRCNRWLCIAGVFLASCFSHTAMMNSDNFETIAIGAPITSIENQMGRPYKIHNKEDGRKEYEYVERIRIGQCLVSENHYFLVVVNGEVISKYMTQEKSPAYDLIYIEDPNHPCYH